MTDDNSSALNLLISAVVEQAGNFRGSGPAELLRNGPQSSFQIARSAKLLARKTPFRPHLWPQPSVVAPQHMCCLSCGVSFWGRRAQRSCPSKRYRGRF